MILKYNIGLFLFAVIFIPICDIFVLFLIVYVEKVMWSITQIEG